MVLIKHIAQPAFIQLVNVGLDTWGKKQWIAPEFPLVAAAGESPLASLRWVRTEFTSFDSSFNTNFKSRSLIAEICMGLIVLLFVLLVLGLVGQCMSRCDEEDVVGTPKSQKALAAKKESQDDSTAPKKDTHLGTWAQAYSEATGPEREALDLLFRCQIVSVYEFTESRVGRDHIDECIRIARQMLQQRSMSDWIALRYRAKQIFQERAHDVHDATSHQEAASLDSVQSLQDHAAASLQSQYYAHATSATSRDQSPSPPQSPMRMVMETRNTPPIRPIVPRMDLHGVNDFKNQSSDKDDDDPFTTRDYYQA